MNINNPTTFSAPDLTYTTSNSSGTSGALRADDSIAIFSASTPAAVGASGATGDDAFASRLDHVHAGFVAPTSTDEALARYTGTSGALQNYTSNALLASDAGVITLASGQIVFPATQAASAGANTFDDYEESTWTPDLSDGSNSASYSTRAGFFTKIGRLCVCTGTFTLSSLGSVSGSVRIAGLPFASDTTASDRGVAAFTRMLALNITAGQSVSGYVDNGDSHVSLRLNDADAGDSAMTGAEVSADGSMQFVITYFTA